MADSDKRRRNGQERRTYEARRDREARELDRQINKAFRRRWAARIVLLLALGIAVQHWLAHIGDWSTGWQDLLVGYPTAALVAVVGLIMLPRTPSHH